MARKNRPGRYNKEEMKPDLQKIVAPVAGGTDLEAAEELARLRKVRKREK
ncbi:hypothetical protein [Calderihabitans maritimus]|uniref:Uncharacterized protein n=1 Tax=Calderihabitans maritimus TaxID=1246530 RepID=A0A1Z5HP33_9FIRM|nr:hypothetical protein [Calderihabitans maritimus]GAW91283.1 hypothetical protein KKC1_04450 [Calderihabitans maritimus]